MADDLGDEYEGPWVDCWSCGGEGVHDDCFEDTCSCLEPPCITRACDVCHGIGGWPAGDSAEDDARENGGPAEVDP